MPDQDVYRKVGRGGAGNFVSSKPEDAANADLEAQNLATEEVQPSVNGPSRAGRGGFGNYVNPEELPDAKEQDEMAQKTAAAVNASLKKNHVARGGLGGRGGAGNWKHAISFEEEERMREEERLRGEQLAKKVKEEVDQGLKMPEKAHHGHHVKHNEQ
ncbi:uncharacterized protein FFB20_06549 [Fusarium fujikuroi]|uniref:Uncharacterized protein n=3 Tax=Fusarium fujikuroi species complex TaxID=171627 RepID=S0DUV1_GIBF5|nr:uncharacterized protein FFUJ_03258 [Fusarium fujikuroi IMI 58289]XP_041679299.1 uncharacterized protein FMAN_04813 [Fusarium mangiferae]KAI1027045.1 hypothetical protein LB504_007729 [Fusarium proliferatum]KLO89750.1 uncharacterized protein LW93_1811 [Fusarium fujikuroi]KLP01775.1 uncharacterized protein Y057_14152 [Fusarium fujikuroi]KLP11715.1 uncharacterized protein LW94_13357 [Fusarium fujikuroi]QGI62438.1 hypothetical protein CEK27_006409 [Fusarium fujikuroi]